MIEKALEILEESIKLEKKLADIYSLFQKKFKEDSTFWWLLTNEETNHAALLTRLGKDFAKGEFPESLIFSSLEILIRINKEMDEKFIDFKTNGVTKEQAAQFALNCEENAYELHFQMIVSEKADSEIMKKIRILNFSDKNHAKRIREYFNLTEE